MSNLHEEKNKRQAILDAAEKIFTDKGYAAAKTTEIAAAAGVTHAMLHYYFSTKENLFNTVFERKIQLLGESILPLFLQEGLPLPERLQAAVEAHFDFLVANPGLPRFVVNELIADPERRGMLKNAFHGIKDQIVERLGMELEREAAKGTIRRIDPVDLLIDILSLNLYIFLVLPIADIFAPNIYKDVPSMLAARRRENVEVILQRIKKA